MSRKEDALVHIHKASKELDFHASEEKDSAAQDYAHLLDNVADRIKEEVKEL